MTWSAALGPWNVGPVVDLPLQGLSVTWKRSDSSEANFTLQAWHQAFGQVVPTDTDLWVWHNASVLLRGRCGGHSGGGSIAAATRQHSAADYREVLARRMLAGATTSWTNTDPADSAWTVLNEEQQRPGSNLGIVRGTGSTMVKSGALSGTSTVEAGKPVQEAIDTLTKLANGGADWDITPTSETGLRFDWWSPSRGTDRGVVVDLGGVATSFTDQVDTSSYANAGRFSGQAPASGGGTAPAPVQIDTGGLASRPEGRWEIAEATDQTTTAALTKYATNRIAESQTTAITWAAVLTRGWWQGPQHLFVGDPFEWVCRVPALDPDTQEFVRWAYDVDETMVLEQITADFDGGTVWDEETDRQRVEPKVTLTFGAPLKDERFYQKAADRRLAALERH